MYPLWLVNGLGFLGIAASVIAVLMWKGSDHQHFAARLGTSIRFYLIVMCTMTMSCGMAIEFRHW